MKKFGSLLMSTLLCASLLAGCSSSASVSQSTVPETISTAEGANRLRGSFFRRNDCC